MMMIRLENIKTALDTPQEELWKIAAHRLRLRENQITKLEIRRKSLDARQKRNLNFVYTVEIELADRQLAHKILRQKIPGVAPAEQGRPVRLARGTKKLSYPPVIIGAGPAGLFAALKLAGWGYRPLVLERGKAVAERQRDIELFWQTGSLNLESNVQFGEGGAGTFSDGKLTTRSKDPRVAEVLQLLVEAGAPPEIVYLHKPHLGTDKLRKIVANIRTRLLGLGGQVIFQAKVTNLFIQKQSLQAIEVNGKYQLPVGLAVLATGHSARDTFAMLAAKGLPLEPKPFALGVRIEHPQHLIDRAQYGDLAGHPGLGAADYKLTYQSKEYRRGAYSFCMCPGGYVVAGASEEQTVVTNGMSEYRRDTGIANSGLVVTVGVDDYPGDDPLAGIAFQRIWERQAFELGGKNYQAPAQTVEDYLADRTGSELGETVPTYRPGVTPANLRAALPKEVGEVLAEALVDFDRKIAGFAGSSAVLTGVETRTSSPLRLGRGDDFQVVGLEGLYPAGEGPGYAGGIISAAIDGLRVAEAIIGKYALPAEEYRLDWQE